MYCGIHKSDLSRVILVLIGLSVSTFFVTWELVTKKPDSCEWKGIKGKCVSSNLCLTTLGTRCETNPVCPDKGGKFNKICCTDCKLVNDTSNFIISATSDVFWKDGRKARDACLQYLKDVPHKCHQEGFDAGISRSLRNDRKCHAYTIWRIRRAPPPGSDPPSENPYEALMGFGKDLESAIWMTAGAIISEKFILTSAHGHTTASDELPLTFAAVGVKNRKSDKKDWQIHTVKRIYQHPEYKMGKGGGYPRYNDIALLQLETPITFNKDVLPACLPDPAEEFEIREAKFSSWKKYNQELANVSEISQIIHVKELTATECDAQITEAEGPIPVLYNTYLPQKIKSESQLCYGNKSTCLNVVGGSLAVTTQYSRCMNTVIGVNAYVDKCGPTVFTKVQHFTPWIESIVWP